MTGGPAGDSGAAHLVAGTRLPAIALSSTRGGTVDLSALEGRAIVFVYPYTGRPGTADPPGWDHIPGAHGSTPQAEGFRDHHAAFSRHGYAVFGISGQSPDWQAEFATRKQLPFALLSDARFALADALRLPRFETGGVAYMRRLTLLVENGAITEAVDPVPDPGSNAAAILARVLRA
jgi:peroxiredoxin